MGRIVIVYSGTRCAVLSGAGISWRSLFQTIETACSECAPVTDTNPSDRAWRAALERVIVDQVEVVVGSVGNFQGPRSR